MCKRRGAGDDVEVGDGRRWEDACRAARRKKAPSVCWGPFENRCDLALAREHYGAVLACLGLQRLHQHNVILLMPGIRLHPQ